MMRQGFDTQLSEEEIKCLYSFAEKNAMEELVGVELEELKRHALCCTASLTTKWKALLGAEVR